MASRLYRATKCLSTLPVLSIVPIAKSQTKKAVPIITAVTAAVSNRNTPAKRADLSGGWPAILV